MFGGGGDSYSGGGGFVQNSPGGFGQSPSGRSPAGNKKKGAQQLTPLTIKQILNAESNDSSTFNVDGKTMSQVSIVGLVVSVEVMETNVNYVIDDGSGQVNVKHYKTDEEDGGCREDVYVRAIGNIRKIGQSEMPSLVAFNIEPLKDQNEITLHGLDVIYAHARNTKGALQSENKSAPAGGSNSFSNFGGGNTFNDQGANGGGDNGMDGCTSAVLSTFQRNGSTDEAGTSIPSVVQALQGQFSEAQIRKSVEFLTNEGHLYSTIDEEHLNPTS